MSLDSYTTIVRYTSSCILSFFLFQFAVSLINYFRHGQRKAFWHSAMCFITASYCFFLAFGTHFINKKLANLNLIMLWIIAYAAYYCYLRAIEVYFGYNLSKLKFSKIFCIAFCSIHGLFGLTYIFLNVNPMFNLIAANVPTTVFNKALHITIIPSIWSSILGSMGLGVILYSSFIIWKDLNKSSRNEIFLKIGICITVFGAFHDTSIALEVFGFLVPIYYLGNAFEAMRFNYYYLNEAHNMVDQLETEVIRLSKVAQFGFAAGSIAHDIRNYLFIINTSIHRLSKDEGIENRAALDRIRKYVLKIGEITQLYMNIFKSKTATERRPVSILDIKHEALELLEEKFKEAQVRLDISECRDFEVNCNQTEVAICLVNLIKNSIEEVSTKENSWVKLSTCPVNRTLRVIDSGNGISDSIIQHIFDFGFSAKANQMGKGHGIGLAITKQILEKSGCTLSIDRDCENTCFVIGF